MVGQMLPNRMPYGQTQFVPGAQTSTANVWATRLPTAPFKLTYGDLSVAGAVQDQRPLAFISRKYTICGVTLPAWAWAASALVIYRVLR